MPSDPHHDLTVETNGHVTLTGPHPDGDTDQDLDAAPQEQPQLGMHQANGDSRYVEVLREDSWVVHSV